MVNTNPRRKNYQPPSRHPDIDGPWSAGDPTRRIGLNTPIPEPLMLMLDYLVENRVIRSKASFIRDTVAAAAEAAIRDHIEEREVIAKIRASRR